MSSVTKTKHIDIVGVPYEGVALCYRTICLPLPSLRGAPNVNEVRRANLQVR